jgi:hypothetical protein
MIIYNYFGFSITMYLKKSLYRFFCWLVYKSRNEMPKQKQKRKKERKKRLVEREVGMVPAGMTHQAVADHFNVSRITISRLMIRPRQTGRTNDRTRNDRLRVTPQRQDRHLRLKYVSCTFSTRQYHDIKTRTI